MVFAGQDGAGGGVVVEAVEGAVLADGGLTGGTLLLAFPVPRWFLNWGIVVSVPESSGILSRNPPGERPGIPESPGIPRNPHF